jgi:hypothetical protein
MGTEIIDMDIPEDIENITPSTPAPEGHLHDVRISVSAEMSEHYTQITEMRDKILGNAEAEDKTKIMAINSVTTIIKELAKVQESLYNSERFAVLQQVIVSVLKETDRVVADKVMAALEARLETL